MPMSKYAQSLAEGKKAKADAAKADAEKAIADAKLLLQQAVRNAAAGSTLKNLKVKNLTTQESQDQQNIDFPDLMNWIYTIPYSRRLTFIPSDFSDGVLVAEIVKHFVPELVDLHNYQHANGRTNKRFNWELMNRKVFPQLGFRIGSQLIEQIISPKRYDVHDTAVKHYPIEKLLKQIQQRLSQINSSVFDYRTNPKKILDPFQKKDVKRQIRPISRQPLCSTTWRLELQAAAKYGEYKGNPITWDNVYIEEEEVIAASIGVSNQRHAKWKQDRIAMKLKEAEDAAAQALKCEVSEMAKVDNLAAVKSTDSITFNEAKESESKEKPQDLINDQVSVPVLEKSEIKKPVEVQGKVPNNIIEAESLGAVSVRTTKFCPSRSYVGLRSKGPNGSVLLPEMPI